MINSYSAEIQAWSSAFFIVTWCVAWDEKRHLYFLLWKEHIVLASAFLNSHVVFVWMCVFEKWEGQGGCATYASLWVICSRRLKMEELGASEPLPNCLSHQDELREFDCLNSSAWSDPAHFWIWIFILLASPHPVQDNYYTERL